MTEGSGGVFCVETKVSLEHPGGGHHCNAPHRDAGVPER